MNFQLSTWKNQEKKVRIVYLSGESDTAYIKSFDNIGISVVLENDKHFSSFTLRSCIPYTAIRKIYECD